MKSKKPSESADFKGDSTAAAVTPEQRALVEKLVADGLEIQHKFKREPLYRETGKGHYTGNTVEEIRQARKLSNKEDKTK